MSGKESIFAKTIINQRYAHTKLDGALEDWKEISHRVPKHVLNVVDLPKDIKNDIENIIYKKQFIPAGRYLFATGYEYHQTNNCLSLRAEDSREGWGDLLQKAGLALMTGAGIGINYSALREEGAVLKRIGGFSSGPISLMEMINEVGRQVKQGGTRRAANMAILSWKHPDIYKFIEIKNWSDFIKEAKAKDFNFPAPIDGTNISIQLDDEFFKAFHNINHKLYSHATSVYWATIEHMLKAGEPGFTIDTNDNAKEDLRNAPICDNTQVLLYTGYTKVKDIINKPVTIWTGVRWANDVIFRKTKSNADIVKVSLSNGKYICCEKEHPFLIEHKYTSDILRISANKLEVNDICYVVFPNYNDTIINNVCVTNVEHLQEKEDVYCCNVGYEEHSFMAEGILISNCGEMTSEDDSEICIAKGTKILTKVGYKNIELLTLDDEIGSKINNRTIFRKPLHIINNGIKEIFNIKLTNGQEINLTSNHKVLTNNGWKKVEELLITADSICTNHSQSEYNDFNYLNNIDVEYYTLGWLIGDGWLAEKKDFGFVFGSIEDTESEQLIYNYIRQKYNSGYIQVQKNGVKCLYITSQKVKQQFENNYKIIKAKARNRRVPLKVFESSVIQKISFLTALFAADGTVKTSRINTKLASSSIQLLQDAQLLLDELGIYSRIDWFKVKNRNDQGILCISGTELVKFNKLIGYKYHKNKQNLLNKKLIPHIDSLNRKHGKVKAKEFTPIETIKNYGYEIVYDISMPQDNPHLIANGIIVHNCNLASINLARIDSLEEMEKVVELGTIFLLAGSIYGDVPYEKVKIIRDKNRKIGLGILGLHEWLLMRNKKYDIDEDLAKYMKIYAKTTEIAHKWCNKFNINKSIKTRAIAPSGTISLIAETSSGIEPILCSAYKRRYRKGADLIEYQYVLDPTAKKLADKGINVESIEDAYTLSEDVERRIKVQAWLQTEYVDQGISSTINLPAFGTPQNNHDTIIPFGNMLMQYLPKLRGITVYPANSRGAQPITPISWKTAEKHVGQVFIEGGDVCSLKGGSCNS